MMPIATANCSLKEFVERAPSAIAMLDRDMRYVAVSSRFLVDRRLTKYTVQSLLGRSHYEVFPNLPEQRRALHRRALAGETFTAEEDLMELHDGKKDWIRWQMEPWWLSDEAIGGILISSEIITARKKAEEALAASESLLRLSQEAGQIGSWDWDLESNEVRWSDFQFRQFGFEPTGGKPVPVEAWRSLVSPDDLPRLDQTLKSLFDSGNSSEMEYRINLPRGQRWFLSRVHVRRNESGKAVHLLGIDMDITERRALEENLRELNRTLEKRVQEEVAGREAVQSRLYQSERLQSIGQLTGGIAHDFNNLLTVITGTIDVLAELVADQPEAAKIVNSIESAADRGARLTTSLLAFARKQPLQPQDVDVDRLAQEACRMLEPTLGRQIEIRFVKTSGEHWVRVDSAQLTSSIVNLGINARDAMPNGGTLTLEVKPAHLDEKDAALRDLMPGNYVTIVVQDTGTGIPEPIRDKIFEPFFTTKDIGKGTGLGLSSTFGFVKQSNGHIEFHSVEGGGSTFTIYLPATDRMSSRSVPSSCDEPLQYGDKTILCVEDDKLVREFVAAQLLSLGYKTIVVGDANSALSIIESPAAIDLVFTDIIMPGGMSGWQLANRARQKRPELKFLFTSGYSNIDTEHVRPELLLKKPYRRQELSNKIFRALDLDAALPSPASQAGRLQAS